MREMRRLKKTRRLVWSWGFFYLSHWKRQFQHRLMMALSFGDLRNVKLHFWANVEGTHPLIHEVFGPLMGQYGKYIEIKKFDAPAEIKKVCSHYESEKSTGELNLGRTFGSRNWFGTIFFVQFRG